MRNKLLIILFFTSTFLFANQIDNLKTSKDVESFAKKVYPKFTEYDWEEFRIITTDSIANKVSCTKIYKNLNIKNWEKLDINNDGLTDLLLTVYWGVNLYTYIIIDQGDEEYKTQQLSSNVFETCELFKPILKNNFNYLKVYLKRQKSVGLMDYEDVILNDTLVYKFNEFIELNEKPSDYKVKEIEFQTSGCYGTCPIFNLKIDNNGNAKYNGQAYMKHIGKSKMKIPIKSFNELTELLEYIKVKELENNYAVPWTDDQTSTLKIYFEDNSVKIIKDYGLLGTFGLKAIYNKLIEIGKKTEWKK